MKDPRVILPPKRGDVLFGIEGGDLLGFLLIMEVFLFVFPEGIDFPHEALHVGGGIVMGEEDAGI